MTETSNELVLESSKFLILLASLKKNERKKIKEKLIHMLSAINFDQNRYRMVHCWAQKKRELIQIVRINCGAVPLHMTDRPGKSMSEMVNISG